MQKVAPGEALAVLPGDERAQVGKNWTNEALEIVRRKDLVTLEMELSGAADDFSGALDISSLDILAHPQRHMKRMMQCPNRLGVLWQRRRKETGGALTWKVIWRSWRSKVFCPGPKADPWILRRKMGHWSARTKITKEESEEPKGAGNEKQEKEMEVEEATPHEASAEVQSPKRKVIRVESEETQDYVRETLAISQEEAEEYGLRCQVPW